MMKYAARAATSRWF